MTSGKSRQMLSGNLETFAMLLLTAGAAFAAAPQYPQIPERPPPVVVKQGNSSLISRIESKLGRGLTAQQRQEIERVIRQSASALADCQNQFLERVAAILSTPESRVKAIFASSGPGELDFDRGLIPKLEGQLGRVLSTSEIDQLRKADAQRQEAVRPVQMRLAERLATVTRLPADEIRDLLTKGQS